MTSSPQPGPRKAEILLLVLFLLSLPLLNPWVRGDGVGYYAFARAPLIEHSLDFTHDYQQANTSFRENRLDKNGQPTPEFRTRTGHLENHFTVGPAILWAPFLVVTHAGVLLARSLGSAIPADGFSAPYRIAMALATAFYAFLALLISFRIARKYVDETWALLATLAIWWASSLPVYMYFNPSWSHAHSAFVVALFLWYWHETRDARSLGQWILLGALAGLMLDVYYANVMLFVILPFEAARDVRRGISQGDARHAHRCATPRAARRLRGHASTLHTADVYRPPHHLWKHLRDRLCPRQPLELGLAVSFVCPVFLESRIDFLDAGSALRRNRALCFLAQRAARWRSLSAGGARVLLFHRVLSRLDGHLFVWQPLFCFAHRAFCGGARRFSGPLHAHLSQARRRSRGFVRFSGLLCFVERGIDVPVGFAPDSRARPYLFSADDPESIFHRAAPNLRAARNLSIPPQSDDAADRAA